MAVRVMRFLLLTTTAICTPVIAAAEPVSAFFIGLTGGAIGGFTGVAATTAAIGAFFGTSLIGSLLLNIGLAYLLRPEIEAPEIERARVNTRIPDAPRYQLGGSVMIGGAAGAFAEYDNDKNFWYIVAHGDAEMVGDPQYYLDGIPVTLAEFDQTLTDPVQAVSETDIDLADAPATIGGYPMDGGTRVLLVGQTDATENGIYVFNVGSPNTLTRASDLPAAATVNRGFAVQVARGFSLLLPVLPTVIGQTWRVAADGVIVGTDDMPWEESDAGTFHKYDVLTDEFCFNEDKEVYDGDGERRVAFRVYTVTPDSSQVYGDLPADFTDAFPNLPEDFLLAGVCYSIVRVRDVSTNAKPLVWRWNGPIGIGEPAVAVYANFSRVPDTRESGVDETDPSTWVAGDGNPAVLWAWWRLNGFGRNRDASEINWAKVEEAADICDTIVTDRSGDPVPLYRCGVAIPDTMTRHEAEQEILKTMDAFVAYDDEGKAYPVPGYYAAPTLDFTSERDIFTAATQLVDDGEQPMDGVVVRYLSPEHDYTKQPCAPWTNPDFYDAAREPNFLYVDILGCQNHNQAVRLAKAIGGRAQASQKAALGTTIKGILAKRERSISLAYDSVFTGVYEIATPVKQQGDGMACAFSVVPLASDRWTLNEGEEGAPPAPTPALNIDNSLSAPSNVVLTSEPVLTDNGVGVRISATFDEADRDGDLFRFRYAPAGTFEYEYFTVDMDRLYAYSALVDDGTTYDVAWKTVNGDKGTVWSDIEQITVLANDTAPDDLVAASATGGVGQATLAWTTANDPNQFAVEVRRGATTTFASATLITTIVTPANTEGGATDSGLAAGTYYYWFTPINGSGIGGTNDGPYTATVT